MLALIQFLENILLLEVVEFWLSFSKKVFHFYFQLIEKDVSLALSKLKAFPLINGYRGNPQGDVEMIIDCVMATVKLVSENDIDELDINPLLVLKRGSGVIAVDTLIKLNLG